LGGVENDKTCTDLQQIIDKMLQIGVDVNDINQSSFYRELLRNVKHNDVCFSKGTTEPKNTGECNIDLIVDRYLKEDNPTIYVVQNVTKFAQSNVIVGVLTIEVKTNKSRFMVDMSGTQDNHSKAKYLFLIFHNENDLEKDLRSDNIKIYISIKSSSYYCNE